MTTSQTNYELGLSYRRKLLSRTKIRALAANSEHEKGSIKMEKLLSPTKFENSPFQKSKSTSSVLKTKQQECNVKQIVNLLENGKKDTPESDDNLKTITITDNKQPKVVKRKRRRKRKRSFQLLPEQLEAQAVVERLKKRATKKYVSTVPSIRINGKINNAISLEIRQTKQAEKFFKPSKEFDSTTPYACIFCQNFNRYHDVLYGPYNLKINGKSVEVWLHDDCAVWSAGVYVLDNGCFIGLEDILSENRKCSICLKSIASVPCVNRFCNKVFHWSCITANRNKFNIDSEKFIIKCLNH